jgi:osmotically-inducible protein OsmY
MEAENAAKRVVDVKATVEKIKVKFPKSWSKNNVEIAEEVIIAIEANWCLPKGKVTVKVEDGCVTLEGELPWNYQKENTKNLINYLAGVKGVINSIKIKSENHNSIEKKASMCMD